MGKFDTYILLILFVFFIAGILSLCAPVEAREWTTQEKEKEAAWQVLNLIDWGQTLDIVKEQESGSDKYMERNPILGKRPSRGKVNTYFITSHILHYLVTNELTTYRAAWQNTTLIISGIVVSNNFYIGLKFGY